MVGALALALLSGAGCGGASRSPSTAPARAAPRAAAPVGTARRQVRPRARHQAPARDPGTLPQTRRLPSADAAFRAEMRALWRGVGTGSVRAAHEAFFPATAYVQIKAIANPDADFTGRLLGDYALDVAAAHRLLGPAAHRARLIGVKLPRGNAHWVPPGVCENRVGYWEVPNARVVYREGGAVRSFGIASMISWRGRWYVVHLGAVVRSGAAGLVDDPQAGPGSSAPSSIC